MNRAHDAIIANRQFTACPMAAACGTRRADAWPVTHGVACISLPSPVVRHRPRLAWHGGAACLQAPPVPVSLSLRGVIGD